MRKKFRFSATAKLELRADVFNVFNRVNFNNPNIDGHRRRIRAHLDAPRFRGRRNSVCGWISSWAEHRTSENFQLPISNSQGAQSRSTESVLGVGGWRLEVDTFIGPLRALIPAT